MELGCWVDSGLWVGPAATVVDMATVEEAWRWLWSEWEGSRRTEAAPLLTGALHSLEGRDSTPRVGEEPHQELGVRGVDGVAAEHLPRGPDTIRRAL